MRNVHSSQAPITPGKIRSVALALLAGVVLFGVVTAVITAGGEGMASPAAVDPNDPNSPPRDDALDILKWIALAMLVMTTALGAVLRGARLRTVAEMEDEEAAGQAYAGANLLFFAMVEGGALFNLVVWLILGDPVPNAFAAALAVMLMAVNLPGEESFRRLRELNDLSR